MKYNNMTERKKKQFSTTQCIAN